MHWYKGLKGNSATRRVEGGKGKVVKGIQGELTNIKHFKKRTYGNVLVYKLPKISSRIGPFQEMIILH